MTYAMQRVTRARSTLVLDHPWFGVLSLRLKVIEEQGLGTMATDGSHLYFDPEFVDSMNDSELAGVVAHEVMHCAMRHMYRTNGREMKQWNRAADLAINPLLLSSGFTLPKGALNEPRFNGQSAETIYAQLDKERPQEEEAGSESQGTQGDQPCPTGEFGPPADDPGGDDGAGASPDDAPMTETDWEVATEQATAIASKRGHVGADVKQAVEMGRSGGADWREVLREFVQQVIPSDFSWSRPNRRHIAGGLYLPGVVREGCPWIGVAIDTSGSINQELLNIFAAEMNAILHEVKPERIDVVYADTSVKSEQSFTPADELTPDALNAKGGGGTAFQPTFDHFSAQDDQPAAVVYFTDLHGDQPTAPDYPVLWVTPEWIANKPAPFGRVVKLSKFQ